MFLDASAIVAIIVREADHENLITKLEKSEKVLFSSMSAFETTLAIARIRKGGLTEARRDLAIFLRDTKGIFVPISEAIGDEALRAHERFGKTHHRAKLNMGDCFSYACAKVMKVPLLCKGDEFIHTDIRIA
jgi:ribonuclease VapC